MDRIFIRGCLHVPTSHMTFRSYVYGDAQFTAERYAKPRLMEIDGGFATRPFSRFENLEFRAGNDVIMDVQANTTRDLVYGAVRIAY